MIGLPGHRPSSRRGAGILLVLVAIVLAGLLVAGLGRMGFARRVQTDAAAAAAAEQCRQAVQSALDEAAHRFSTLANEPSSSVHSTLRKGSSFAGEIEVPTTLQQLEGGRVALAKKVVAYRFQTDGVEDWPYVHGRVTFEAAATDGWLSRASRSGTMSREVRLSRVTPLAPLDEVALLILRPFDGLVDAASANRSIQEGEEQVSRLGRQRHHIDSLLRDLSAALEPVPELARLFRERLARLSARPLPEHPRYTSSLQARFHYFDPQSVVMAFESIADLAALGVTRREAAAFSAKAESLTARQARTATRLESQVHRLLGLARDATANGREAPARLPGGLSGAELAGPARPLVEQCIADVELFRLESAEAATAMVERSMRYTRVTDALVEYGGQSAREVRQVARQLFDLPSAWKRRASLHFDSAGKFTAFLERYRQKGEGVRGIAWVEDSQRPVSLDGLEFRGRLALACPGRLTAAGQTLDGEESFLTLVCDRFALQGHTRASVVCRRFGGTPGGALHGQLLIDELESAEDLRGSLEFDRRFDPKRASGRDDETLQVVLSPFSVGGAVGPSRRLDR